MKFGGIGMPELLIILAVALLIFGPKNLPKLGSALGKTVKNLRDGMGSAKDGEVEIDEEVDVVEKASGSSAKKTAVNTSSSEKKKETSAEKAKAEED